MCCSFFYFTHISNQKDFLLTLDSNFLESNTKFLESKDNSS